MYNELKITFFFPFLEKKNVIVISIQYFDGFPVGCYNIYAAGGQDDFCLVADGSRLNYQLTIHIIYV